MNAYEATIAQAANELADAAARVPAAQFDAAAEAIVAARRIVVYGVGREGLMMRALAMRLYHLGCDAHVVGDMSAPAVGSGDLFVCSAGPGHFSTVEALIEVARSSGARTLCVTAQPAGPAPSRCDTILTIPGQTMADDTGGQVSSVLPMGSLYEGAQYLVFEVLVLRLRERLGSDAQAMRARHTNLE